MTRTVNHSAQRRLAMRHEHAGAQRAQMPLVEVEDPLHGAPDVAPVWIDVQLCRPALEHVRGIAARQVQRAERDGEDQQALEELEHPDEWEHHPGQP